MKPDMSKVFEWRAYFERAGSQDNDAAAIAKLHEEAKDASVPGSMRLRCPPTTWGVPPLRPVTAPIRLASRDLPANKDWRMAP